MSKKTEKVAQAEVSIDSPTMEDILSSIRKIINDDSDNAEGGTATEEDVLELTEVLNDDGSITSLVGEDSNMMKKQVTAAAKETESKKFVAFEEPAVSDSAGVTAAAEHAEEEVGVLAAEASAATGFETAFSLAEDLAGAHKSDIPENLTSIFQDQERQDPSASVMQDDVISEVFAELEQQEEKVEAPTMTDTQETARADAASDQDGILSQSVADASVATLAALSKRMNRRKIEPVGDQTVDQLMRSVLKPLLREWLDDHLPQVVERMVAREVNRLVQRSEYEEF